MLNSLMSRLTATLVLMAMLFMTGCATSSTRSSNSYWHGQNHSFAVTDSRLGLEYVTDDGFLDSYLESKRIEEEMALEESLTFLLEFLFTVAQMIFGPTH